MKTSTVMTLNMRVPQMGKRCSVRNHADDVSGAEDVNGDEVLFFGTSASIPKVWNPWFLILGIRYSQIFSVPPPTPADAVLNTISRRF